MKHQKRIIFTLLLALVCIVGVNLFDLLESPIKGALTAQQLDDTLTSYMSNRAMADDVVLRIFVFSFLIILALIWLNPLMNYFFPENKTNKNS
jgi:hypothetical protein